MGTGAIPTPAPKEKKTRKKSMSRLAVPLSIITSSSLSRRRRKPRAETPTTNIASVARRNGAPRIAPMPTSPAALLPVKIDATMATMGIMVSGRAVPTAASTLPTDPWSRSSRSPRISTALVNSAAATTMATAESTSSTIVIDIGTFLRWLCRIGGFYPAATAVTLRHMPDLPDELERILAAVAGGVLSPSAAAGRLRSGEVRYLDEFAVLDLGRQARKGVPEVVYAPGKTPEQVARICETLLASTERVIVSDSSPEVTAELRRSLPKTPVRSAGRAVAISAGTSDVPVLGEAVAVAREMGAAVRSFHDVGVAGIHRLTQPLEELRSFDPDCLIVAAGMEGALPSVVAGLVAVPVVGLPTSTGYGLGGDGTAAILGMLQTCSPGLSVVNVDNGIGAGATAARVAN